MQTKKKKIDLIIEARKMMNSGGHSKEEIKSLVDELIANDQFYYATEIYYKLLGPEVEDYQVTETDYQNLAKYIYKDHSLSSSFKFDKAFTTLKKNVELKTSQNYENFGLAGAIHKRKWYFDRNPKDLALARYFYEKGYALWLSYISTPDISLRKGTNDCGYTAINLSFITEQIALLELQAIGNSNSDSTAASVKLKLEKTTEIRERVLKEITNNASPYTVNPGLLNPVNEKKVEESFIYATVIEALLGLGKYEDARRVIIDLIPRHGRWEGQMEIQIYD